LSAIKNYWFTHGTVRGLKNTLIARTGYTGEDGFEIYVPSDAATSEKVWNQVMEAGANSDHSLRIGSPEHAALESKMALYGHEISDKITCGRRDWTATARWRRAISSDAPRWNARKRQD